MSRFCTEKLDLPIGLPLLYNEFMPDNSTGNNLQTNEVTESVTGSISPPGVKEPPLHFRTTQELINNFEHLFSSAVLTYYVEDSNSIEDTHAEIFLDHLRRIGQQKKLTLILVSSGGGSVGALRIASVIRHYCKYLRIVVPSRCMSAATNLALAADKILMTPAGFLSPIDSYVYHDLNPCKINGNPVYVSTEQLKRVIKVLEQEGPAKNADGSVEGTYRTLFKYLHPLSFGEVDRYSSASKMIAIKLMQMHLHSFIDQEQINIIAHHLVNDYPTHNYPILYSEAKEIGLPVEMTDDSLSEQLRDLVKHYDSSAWPAKTWIDSGFYHTNNYTVMIESKGLRTVFYKNIDTKLNSVSRIWSTENDNSRWWNLVAGKNPEMPPQRYYLHQEIDLKKPSN